MKGDFQIHVLKKFCNILCLFTSVCESSPFDWCMCVVYFISLLYAGCNILFGDSIV